MFNRRNAFIGWAVLRLAGLRLRRQGRRAGGAVRVIGRVVTGVAVAGIVALIAKRFLLRGGPGDA